MKSEALNKNNVIDILLITCFIIFTIPRSIDNILVVHAYANVFKLCAGLFTLGFFIYKRPKLNNFTILLGIYSAYVVVISYLNGRPITTPIKTYGLDLFAILLLNIILDRDNYKEILNIITTYFAVLITLTFIQIGITFIVSTFMAYPLGDMVTILGQDNRLILYVFMEILLLSYLNYKETIKYIVILGLLSMLMAWSIMGFVAMLLMIVVYYLLNKYKCNLHYKSLLLLILLISVGLIGFKIQNLFAPIIVNVLHKSLTLSYRSFIWDAALKDLLSHPVNLIFGFGFFDTRPYLQELYILAPSALTPNHWHNLPLNALYFSGIVGFTIYLAFFLIIGQEIRKIKNFKVRSLYSAILTGLLALLVMDTFEYYQVYYLCLGLLSSYSAYKLKGN